MGKKNEIKLIGVQDEIELRSDIGADDESVAFCFTKVDEVTFKARIPPEAIAIMLGAVRIVRCKDCRHSYDEPGGRVCLSGPCVDCIVADDFFCKYGERREGGADG